VLAYYTSPGLILWLYPSPYPDTWGPFLSRNNFAQFLELALPVALWFAIRERSPRYAVVAAAIFAAGLASASRAGAALLTAECVVVWWLLLTPRPPALRILGWFAATAAGLAVLAGASHLDSTVLSTADPFEYRREIAQSTLGMIREHPGAARVWDLRLCVSRACDVRCGPRGRARAQRLARVRAEGGWPYAALWILLALGDGPRGDSIGVGNRSTRRLPARAGGLSLRALWASRCGCLFFLGAMETIRSPEPLRLVTRRTICENENCVIAILTARSKQRRLCSVTCHRNR
jgi:hypothetical protein